LVVDFSRPGWRSASALRGVAVIARILLFGFPQTPLGRAVPFEIVDDASDCVADRASEALGGDPSAMPPSRSKRACSIFRILASRRSTLTHIRNCRRERRARMKR